MTLSIAPEIFATAMELLGVSLAGETLAVAVSGGADSMALCLLAHRWAKKHNIKLVALTVDHKLRKESSAEARKVAGWLKKRGIEHHTLTLPSPLSKQNLQAQARAARYARMAEFCTTHEVSYLLLAHHQDDQAETFLLRLARGSGVDGLAAMQPVQQLHGITLLRPLLAFPKSHLIATLQQVGQEWVEDSSNNSDAYARNRMRMLMPALEKEGITGDRLAKTAAILREARDALEHYTHTLLAASTQYFAEGYVLLQPEPFRTAPRDVALRAFTWIISAITGEDYKPRRDPLIALFEAVCSNDFRRRTFGGCVFSAQKDGRVLVQRELKPITDERRIRAGETVLWDGRFHITLTSAARKKPYLLRPLGVAGWLNIRSKIAHTLTLPPKTVLYTLPALYDLEAVAAAPHIEYDNCGGKLLSSLRVVSAKPVWSQPSP